MSPLTACGDRSLFPDLRARAYLAWAAISPPSLPVRAAMEAAVRCYAERGLDAWQEYRDQREELRGDLARLIDADEETVALVPNTSSGVLAVAFCMPWRSGDRILLFEGEFPANVTPWQRAAELFDLEIRVLPCGDRDAGDDDPVLGRLEQELRRGARLVATSAVRFQTGRALPLGSMAELCRRHGAELFVDGIQALGAVPLSVRELGVDYLACGGHKWLNGPEGTGFLHVRADRLAALHPRIAGWLSHEDPARFLFGEAGELRFDRPIRRRADFLELGCMSSVTYAGLGAAVRLLLDLGVPSIHAHAQPVLEALESGLEERGFRSLRARQVAARSCILGVLPPAGIAPATLRAGLVERGVLASTPDGLLRFAVHWPNAATESAVVLDAIDEVLAVSRG